MQTLHIAHEMARRGIMASIANAPLGTRITISQGDPRTLEQNAKLWAMLSDVSNQVDWYGQKLANEDWKDLFTAVLRQQRTVPGIGGGFVVLGLRTSKMSKREFSELVEIIYAFGSEKGVQWSEQAKSLQQVSDMPGGHVRKEPA